MVWSFRRVDGHEAAGGRRRSSFRLGGAQGPEEVVGGGLP
eukprot:CAMPEP_0194741998 /NCGR_PEP_ID=MMETSP0296-20130528/98339_1 /TAXON_ID=39354 /ORGANISM="Heterosigma akashiwo, Strain CCMP2393" /LENGTH=39 /DNA_ID= /DNA_START= /DNA_END= /DNA_ORIENTATION=